MIIPIFTSQETKAEWGLENDSRGLKAQIAGWFVVGSLSHRDVWEIDLFQVVILKANEEKWYW